MASRSIRNRLDHALRELGVVDTLLRGEIAEPEDLRPEKQSPGNAGSVSYGDGKPVATRKAYGSALNRIFPRFKDMVVLDAEVSNSTFSEMFGMPILTDFSRCI